MIYLYIYIERTPRCNSKKEIVNIFNLGYLSIEKDFSEQPYHHYLTEKKKEKSRRVILRKRKIRRKRNQQKSF